VNFSYKEIEIISESLSSIKAKFSVLACPGNHEHYMKDADFQRLAEEIRKCNVDLLINENRVFKFNESQLQVVGVDNTNHRMYYADFDKALHGLNKDFPIILLCHDPTNWDRSVRRKRKVDLMLSGHTHGGQIAFEILNSKISPAAFFYKQYAGLYADKEQYLYVNTGVGMVGVPVRAGLPPEITLIRFVDAEKYA
ncbi:MAG: metallophosphoesterase, partial [Candidatus Kapaibacteriota bacterium]